LTAYFGARGWGVREGAKALMLNGARQDLKLVQGEIVIICGSFDFPLKVTKALIFRIFTPVQGNSDDDKGMSPQKRPEIVMR